MSSSAGGGGGGAVAASTQLEENKKILRQLIASDILYWKQGLRGKMNLDAATAADKSEVIDMIMNYYEPTLQLYKDTSRITKSNLEKFYTSNKDEILQRYKEILDHPTTKIAMAVLINSMADTFSQLKKDPRTAAMLDRAKKKAAKQVKISDFSMTLADKLQENPLNFQHIDQWIKEIDPLIIQLTDIIEMRRVLHLVDFLQFMADLLKKITSFTSVYIQGSPEWRMITNRWIILTQVYTENKTTTTIEYRPEDMFLLASALPILKTIKNNLFRLRNGKEANKNTHTINEFFSMINQMIPILSIQIPRLLGIDPIEYRDFTPMIQALRGPQSSSGRIGRIFDVSSSSSSSGGGGAAAAIDSGIDTSRHQQEINSIKAKIAAVLQARSGLFNPQVFTTSAHHGPEIERFLEEIIPRDQEIVRMIPRAIKCRIILIDGLNVLRTYDRELRQTKMDNPLFFDRLGHAMKQSKDKRKKTIIQNDIKRQFKDSTINNVFIWVLPSQDEQRLFYEKSNSPSVQRILAKVRMMSGNDKEKDDALLLHLGILFQSIKNQMQKQRQQLKSLRQQKDQLTSRRYVDLQEQQRFKALRSLPGDDLPIIEEVVIVTSDQFRQWPLIEDLTRGIVFIDPKIDHGQGGGGGGGSG